MADLATASTSLLQRALRLQHCLQGQDSLSRCPENSNTQAMVRDQGECQMGASLALFLKDEAAAKQGHHQDDKQHGPDGNAPRYPLQQISVAFDRNTKGDAILRNRNIDFRLKEVKGSSSEALSLYLRLWNGDFNREVADNRSLLDETTLTSTETSLSSLETSFSTGMSRSLDNTSHLLSPTPILGHTMMDEEEDDDEEEEEISDGSAVVEPAWYPAQHKSQEKEQEQEKEKENETNTMDVQPLSAGLKAAASSEQGSSRSWRESAGRGLEGKGSVEGNSSQIQVPSESGLRSPFISSIHLSGPIPQKRHSLPPRVEAPPSTHLPVSREWEKGNWTQHDATSSHAPSTDRSDIDIEVEGGQFNQNQVEQHPGEQDPPAALVVPLATQQRQRDTQEVMAAFHRLDTTASLEKAPLSLSEETVGTVRHRLQATGITPLRRHVAAQLAAAEDMSVNPQTGNLPYSSSLLQQSQAHPVSGEVGNGNSSPFGPLTPLASLQMLQQSGLGQDFRQSRGRVSLQGEDMPTAMKKRTMEEEHRVRSVYASPDIPGTGSAPLLVPETMSQGQLSPLRHSQTNLASSTGLLHGRSGLEVYSNYRERVRLLTQSYGQGWREG